MHRHCRSLRQRQDHSSRSHPRPHRRHTPPERRRLRQHGRRPFPRSEKPRHERGGLDRHHRLHGRPAHLHRLPRVDRVRLRGRAGACRLRSRHRHRRARREEDPRAAAHHAPPGRAGRAARAIPQQDRQGHDERARCAETAAADERDAAAAAPDSAAQGRHRRRFDRSGPGACLHLPRTRREPGH